MRTAYAADGDTSELSQVGLAQMLKGGVIMDVTTPEEARIAEEAGAVAVMALERVPADIRKEGGVARMSDAEVIHAIKQAVTIPVMAKARIGHFVEAQILEALEVDYIDESEVQLYLYQPSVLVIMCLDLSPYHVLGKASATIVQEKVQVNANERCPNIASAAGADTSG